MRIRLLLPALALIACGQSHREQAATAEPAAADGRFANEAMGGEAAVPLPADRKVIRTGNLTYDVDDLDAARAAILDRVKAADGYVEADDRNDWGSIQAVSLRVRIPADGFDAFVEGLTTLGRLESRSINAADVTAEWVDVEARLAAKRAVEKRYLELAAQAKNVEEMLQVERELGNARAEIESMEARMKALRDQVALSTLTITCQKQVATTERFTPRFGLALKEGWSNLLRFAVRLAELWPFVLIIAGLSWWWRRRKAARGRAA